MANPRPLRFLINIFLKIRSTGGFTTIAYLQREYTLCGKVFESDSVTRTTFAHPRES